MENTKKDINENLWTGLGNIITKGGKNIGKFGNKVAEKGFVNATKEAAPKAMKMMKDKSAQVYNILKKGWGEILKDMEAKGCKGNIFKYQKELEKIAAGADKEAAAIAQKRLNNIKLAKRAGLLTTGGGLVMRNGNNTEQDIQGEEYADNNEYVDDENYNQHGTQDMNPQDMQRMLSMFMPQMGGQMQNPMAMLGQLMPPGMMPQMPMNEEIEGDLVAGIGNEIENDDEAKETIKEIFEDKEYLKFLLKRILENGSPLLKMISNYPEISEKLKSGDILSLIKDAKEDYEESREHQTKVILEMIKSNPKCAIIMIKAIIEVISGAGAPLAVEDLAYLAVEYIKAENKVSKEEYETEDKESVMESFNGLLDRMNKLND